MTKNWFKNTGPGTLVAAAFIGPGTVTLCTLAGVNYGFHLLWAMLLSILATVVLQEMAARLGIISQNYKFLERVLVSLVLLMSVSFLITAFLTKPAITSIFKGALVPSVPEGSLLTIIGLIGTTVVPYNLFLHASLVKEKWSDQKDLKAVRKDTIISIVLGGLVSMAIIISASSIGLGEISNASDLAKSLAPLYGDFASYFLGIGLFAAGITSAITAPLAAAYVARGCFGWKSGLKSKQFRAVWIFILLLGVVFSSLGIKPIEIIKFAQVANGILLPVIAGVLLWVVNKKAVLGKYVNSKLQNSLGIIILIATVFLGLRGLDKVFGLHIF